MTEENSAYVGLVKKLEDMISTWTSIIVDEVNDLKEVPAHWDEYIDEKIYSIESHLDLVRTMKKQILEYAEKGE